MKKKQRPNYMPKIFWECENTENRGYWILHAWACVPGDESLEVTAEYHLPHMYEKRTGGLSPVVFKTIEDMAVSVSYKYNTLVRKLASKNKHAQKALDAIEEWYEQS